MKHFKLFFALFAMLALNVGNAWAETAKIDFSAQNYSNQEAMTEAVNIINGITVQFAKGDGSTAPAYYTSGTSVRLYAKGTMTVSSTIGTITKITLTYGSSDKTNEITTNCGSFSSPDWTGSATEVVFTVGGTKDHRRIKAVEVTYTPSSGETPGEGGGEDPVDPTPGTGGTVTYTVSSVTEVTTTGNVPQGSTAVLSGTGSLNGGFIQCTNGKNHTLTLTGYEGYMITGVTIHVKSNSSKGTGSFSVMAGSTTIASITESAFNTSSWNGSWNTTGVDKTLTMTNDSYKIQSGENVTLTVNCKSGSSDYNSLYVKSYTITYKPVSSSGSGSEETAVSVPTFSVPEGTFYSPINVELSCSTADAEIYYTLDGNTPSSTSEKYTTAIAISETTTVTAIAVKDGLTDSEVATATYTKGETVTSYDIDFETNALEAYVNWDFSNITIASTAITAKEGTYYGNTSGKSTNVYIKTKEEIQYPGTLTFYTSKESGNTTSSSWLVQVSENGTDWTDVSSFSAITGDKGDWTERTTDLSDYENVYVQITYTGSTAVRAIDEISLAQGVAPVKYALTITTPENGSLSITNGVEPVTSGDEFKEGTELNVTATPNSGYKGGTILVKDASDVDVTSAVYADGVLTMPAYAITISATFEVNEKPDATLTLSINGNTDTKINGKQDDVVTLPSIISDCVKEFVGWSANPTCDVDPEYKAGDSYTLASTTQTLYAVYADVTGGETVNIAYSGSTTCNMTGNNDAATLGLDADEWSIISAKGGASNHVGLNKDGEFRLYYSANGGNTLTITAPKTIAVAELDLKVNYNNAWVKVGGNTITPVDGVYTINATEFVIGNANTESKQVHIFSIDVTLQGDYSNYSTTCAAAPKAEVNPAEVTATATGGNGTVSVTYENVNTEGVTVALFNDEACTEEFTTGWLTAAFDADKNITYTVTENTTYAERKAYIQLTAPETTGATEPAKVVIPVTQAGKDKVFASLAELVAADLTAGDEVTVTLNKDVIKSFYNISAGRAGVVFDVQKDGKDIKIFYNNQTTIVDWEVGGKLSGTLTNVKWSTYSNEWQLAPTANTWDWANLTYTEPKAVSTVVVSGAPTKTTYIDGEAFDPAGLTVTVNYNDATSEVNPTGVTFTVTPTTLVKGQTSVSVTATYNSVTSAAYEVTGLTVNDIPTKTVDEFIEAEGGRCYLEGIVSNITNTIYGNFDLTDASGTIYVYGCLNAEGVAQKFAELGVKEGDRIKVVAEEYTYYQSTTHEVINAQYVSHISAATIEIADITMEVGETKNIAATITPDAAKTEVTYSIKTGSDDCITLSENNITAKAEGTATIVATIATDAEGEYMGKTVEFKVTVTPKSTKQNVVILAEYNGKWYAMTNECTDSKQMGALEVDYQNGVLFNVDEATKATITWELAIADGKATFKNNNKYLIGGNSTTLNYANSKFEWVVDGDKYLSDNKSRTFLYNKGGIFKNYDISNAEPTKTEYSGYPVVAAPNYGMTTADVVENAYFSVGNNKYVQFSTGNLQYEVGTNTWSFAEEQYEVIGGAPYDPANPTNTNFGMNVPGYTGKLDLFAWSSDGKYGVNPSNTDADYGTEATDFVDWGTLAGEGWFTLTKEEMNYILNRTKNGKKLWALATIDNLPGLILLPDNWNTNITLTYGYIPTQFVYNENIFTAAEWEILEVAGAVFLPAAGSRTGGFGNKDNAGMNGSYDANGDYFHVDNVGIYGYYWLNTQDPRTNFKHCASYLILPGWDEGPTVDEEGVDDLSTHPQVWSREKRRGNSVRLVKTVEEEPQVTVSGRWELVTDASTLAVGDQVVIAAADYNYALSTTQKENNRGQASIKKEDNTISFSSDVQILTLEKGYVDNTFALYTGTGYLYAASNSENVLKTTETIIGVSSWSINTKDDITTIAAAANSHNIMQYNLPSKLFSCYESASQQAICLYRKKNVKVDSNQNTDDIQNFSDITVGNNSELEVTKPLIVENLYIQTTMGATTSAQIANATNSNLIINGDAFIDITLGKNGDPSRWHAFTVPFPVDAMNGVYDLNDNKLTNEVNYAIMDYHGDLRANGQYGWKKYRGILVPGTFYLMTVDGARTTYRFKKVKGADLVAPTTKELKAYNTGTGESTDYGWNGVGNPTLMHGKVAVVAAAAQILDPEEYIYKTITVSSAHFFTVGTPFFIQAAGDGTMTMVAETSAEPSASLAPARRAAAAVENIKVMLGNSDYTDRLYVSASEDATNEYEIGKDLAKMIMTKTPSVPQIFALAYDTRLCMIDAPMANNEALVALNLYAPANGEYTLSIEAQDNEKVYLLHEGTFVWDLSMSEYPITLNNGDNTGYSILVHRADAPTSVETIDGTNNQTEKLIHNGNLYILHNGKVFDAVGTMLK